MNETLWNSTEEGIGSIILGGVTFLVHFYAILISSAIYDYQGGFQLEFASISQVINHMIHYNLSALIG